VVEAAIHHNWRGQTNPRPTSAHHVVSDLNIIALQVPKHKDFLLRRGFQRRTSSSGGREQIPSARSGMVWVPSFARNPSAHNSLVFREITKSNAGHHLCVGGRRVVMDPDCDSGGPNASLRGHDSCLGLAVLPSRPASVHAGAGFSGIHLRCVSNCSALRLLTPSAGTLTRVTRRCFSFAQTLGTGDDARSR